ncbi:hypothetical protein Apa02nite_013970 [Actinoplanes palleronii]|uniref:Uncharacterized protein n=1 Tax=Actinoplanes palleronii TaxID=113570 RepID=A0ABQ4B3Q0_9ACTN|nr:hypothetical protein Apa02nite_013970 [Actinoplanes palleronii]
MLVLRFLLEMTRLRLEVPWHRTRRVLVPWRRGRRVLVDVLTGLCPPRHRAHHG